MFGPFGMFNMYMYQGGGALCEDFEKMSNIVKYNNKTYFVDTANTSDHGLETMIFKSQDQPETNDIKKINAELLDYSGLYAEYYQSEEDAIKGHNEIIKNIGKYIESEK